MAKAKAPQFNPITTHQIETGTTARERLQSLRTNQQRAQDRIPELDAAVLAGDICAQAEAGRQHVILAAIERRLPIVEAEAQGEANNLAT